MIIACNRQGSNTPPKGLLPKIHLINPWLLKEKFTPLIIRDADKGILLLFSRNAC